MRKILPLLALAVVCVSCDAPFDLSLSRAAAVLPKMTHQGTVGPFSEFGGDEQEMEFSFLPEKESTAAGIDFQNGFLVARTQSRTVLSYATNYWGDYQLFGRWSLDYINPAPRYEPYLFEPLRFPTLPDSPVGVFGLDPAAPGNSSFRIMAADVSTGSLDVWLDWQNLRDGYINFIGPAPLYDADVIGFGIYPTPSAIAFDTTYWLIRMRSTGMLREVAMNLDGVNLSTKNDTKAGSLEFDIPDLALETRCNYFFDPDPVRGPSLDQMKSYVSWYDAATGWKCVSWKGLATVESAILPGITRRIDALLTTGRLLSTQDGIGRLYDSNGNEIAAFPLGGLRFVGERYVNGVPLVLFSLSRIVSEDYSRSLYVDLYSITAADMEGL